jgi:2,5-dihydroxypyridine 5,6-dioxygenase
MERRTCRGDGALCAWIGDVEVEMNASADMVALFRAELELCKVGPDQTVAVLSEGGVRANYAQAFLTAAQELGATAFHINVPAKATFSSDQLAGNVGKTALEGNRPAIEALKQVDILIDLMGLLFSQEQNEITAAGVRVLLVVEPINVLKQMFPNPDLRRRVEFGGGLLAGARELRFTSPHGTDIRYGLSQYPVLTEYGYTDEPGRWDHWPSGFLFTQGNDEEIDGKVVLMPGDIIAAFRRYVQSPIKLTVKRGKVVDIDGDGLDAPLMRSYIESYSDDRAYAVSHIGWGLNERANWHHAAASRELDAEIGMNGLAFYGNVLFSLGPNTELGGKNDTACHLDMPMRNCSLFLDGKPIVENGKIVVEEMRAPGR